MMFDDTEKIKTTEANRGRIIYMLAIDGQQNLDKLDPPATKEEIREFEEQSKRMRDMEAKAKAEGRTLIWDIPFDIDD